MRLENVPLEMVGSDRVLCMHLSMWTVFVDWCVENQGVLSRKEIAKLLERDKEELARIRVS